MSLDLTDPEVFQLTKFLYDKMQKYEQINSLHTEQLQDLKLNQIRPLHPHKKIKTPDGNTKAKKFSCWEIFCQLSVGRYLCCDSQASDDPHKDLGLAMCLYFKSLKHLCCIFILIALLSVISVLLCYLVAIRNDVAVTNSYKQFLFSSSIGVLFLQQIQCTYFLSGTAPVISADFQLTCAVGTVSKLKPVYTTNTYDSITNCNNQLNKIQNSQSEVLASSSYVQTTDCNVDSTFCYANLTITSPSTTYDYISYVYQCNGAVYPVGAINFTRQSITYIIIAIDLFSVLLMLLFVWSQSRAQDRDIEYFRNYQFTLSDYSVQIKHVNTKTSHIQTKQLFQGLNELDPQNYLKNDLVQIKFPDSHHYEQIQKIKIKYSTKVYEIIKQNFFHKYCDPHTFATYQDFIEGQFGTTQKYDQYKQKLVNSVLQYIIQTQNREQSVSMHKSPIVLTFQTMESIQKLKGLRKKKCFKHYLSIQSDDKTIDYRVRQAPIPDLILWENRYKNKHLRRFISWLITIVIIIGSLLLIGYVVSRQNKLLNQYNFNVHCSSAFPTETFAFYDSTKLTNKFYLTCFCSAHAVLSKIVDSQFAGVCSTWSQQYSWYLVLPLVFSFGIVVYNVAISYIFLLLSIFQAHSLLNTQMTSYIIKRSVVLVLNMGVILTFLNFDYGFTDNFLQNYQGTFKDFAGDWYLQIGIIIILTIIFNIAFPMIQLMLYSMLYCFQTLWDRRCFTKKTSLKYKYEYIQMYGGFTYPIQERYATIIAVLFVSLGLNAVLPLINIVILLFLTFLILTDRFLVFKLFRKLPNYQDTLHKHMMKVVFVFLMIHLIITAFLFTQPLLIVNDNTSIVNISNKRVAAIFNTNYILPYPIILFLMILFVIFKYLCNIVDRLTDCCFKNKQNIYQNRQKKPFYEALNGLQMKQLLIISEYESQKQKQLISQINFMQVQTQQPTDSDRQRYRSQRAHIQLEQIQNKKIRKLQQIKKPNYYIPPAPKLVGPASYQKQCNQKVIQEQIQTIALDKISKKIGKRLKTDEHNDQPSVLTFTEDFQDQKLNNILEALEENRLADINVYQPYFRNQSANMLVQDEIKPEI